MISEILELKTAMEVLPEQGYIVPEMIADIRDKVSLVNEAIKLAVLPCKGQLNLFKEEDSNGN